jgi:A/G-specific adenine glycosylase
MHNDHHIDYQRFRQDLLAWYARHKRHLPWRVFNDDQSIPLQQRVYYTWLSEIMLQQTLVKAVLVYFENFVTKWPSVHDLAAAPEDDVMQAWAGLGYYSRARNLHKCAKYVAEQLNGAFPEDEESLLELPGIGPYTAAAIRAIGFNKAATVIDGNIDRILVRLFAIPNPIRDSKKEIRAAAIPFFEGDHLADDQLHSYFAQSLMDLGASICTPKNPKCMICPVREHCYAFETRAQNDIPKAPIKKKKPHKVGRAFIVRDMNRYILVEKRPDKGLLAGTWGMPTTDWLDANDDKAVKSLSWQSYNFNRFKVKEKLRKGAFEIRHVFTHFSLTLYIDEIILEDLDGYVDERFAKLNEDAFKNLGMPSLFDKIRVNYLKQE